MGFLLSSASLSVVRLSGASSAEERFGKILIGPRYSSYPILAPNLIIPHIAFARLGSEYSAKSSSH